MFVEPKDGVSRGLCSLFVSITFRWCLSPKSDLVDKHSGEAGASL